MHGSGIGLQGVLSDFIGSGNTGSKRIGDRPV